MGDAFVVMQIGDSELDRVYATAILPAAEEAGLTARRIDLDNGGGLLKGEIVGFLESSDIIVADLTNERPNCYLEVGYAMGLGRFRNLVLTVRQDHYPGNTGYSPVGPKVHFDLTGYDLLFWDPDDLDSFRVALAERIRRRLAILSDAGSTPGATPSGIPEWIAEARGDVLPDLHRHAGLGVMEIGFWLDPPKISATQKKLLDVARRSTVDTFGWPIGVLIEREDYRPRPTGQGIRTVVEASRWGGNERSYDYWELRVNGDFFQLSSLFEDQRGHSDELFFNTRLVRITEAVLYCARLYENLGVDSTAFINMRVSHGGLMGRTLTSVTPNRDLSGSYEATVDAVGGEVRFSLGAVAEDLVDIVKALAAPLFEVFDFFQLADDVYADIVGRFVAGEVS